jgi:outer membrane protein OmpA-like peptidoglycan-associated protein
MTTSFCDRLKTIGVSLLFAGLIMEPTGVAAQTVAGQETRAGERYVPSIWVDPDGCEHWVLDDGAEGFMTPHLDRSGKPVCRPGNLCGNVNTDQFFATDSFRISSDGRSRLARFFRQKQARGYIISGHTDSRASDAYNLRLSKNRANSVASVARSVGANVIEVRGFGERQPRATNATAEGMSQNRRVEILCVN